MLKNVTFTADESAIERARERALREGTTLNAQVREYIEGLGRPAFDADAFDQSVDAVAAALNGKLPRKFTRDEMNERR